MPITITEVIQLVIEVAKAKDMEAAKVEKLEKEVAALQEKLLAKERALWNTTHPSEAEEA